LRQVILGDEWPERPGGVGQWTRAAAIALRDAGADVTVFVRSRPALATVEGVTVVPVAGASFGRWGSWWTRFAASSAVAKADRVLAATWPVAARITGPLRRLEIPLDVVFHGSDLTRPPVDPRGLERVLRAATRRWAVSRFLAEELARRGFPAHVLPAPVDAAPEGPPRSELRRIGLLARATPLKGGDRFVSLVRALGIEGLVIGDGPELSRWRELAADLPIRFTGAVPRARAMEELATVDLAVLLPRTNPDASGAEGLGLALIEASALGIPVVGCRTGGVPEAVGPGLLLDHPDDLAESAAAIRAWWRPERGAEARAWAASRHGSRRTAAALLARHEVLTQPDPTAE
jgi:glycosyltransferase involved in cell wall biosynthesis